MHVCFFIVKSRFPINSRNVNITFKKTRYGRVNIVYIQAIKNAQLNIENKKNITADTIIINDSN